MAEADCGTLGVSFQFSEHDLVCHCSTPGMALGLVVQHPCPLAKPGGSGGLPVVLLVSRVYQHLVPISFPVREGNQVFLPKSFLQVCPGHMGLVAVKLLHLEVNPKCM